MTIEAVNRELLDRWLAENAKNESGLTDADINAICKAQAKRERKRAKKIVTDTSKNA